MDLFAELSKFPPDSKERVFFENLIEKLGSNFVRKSVEERQREARIKLNKAIEKYFQMSIFVDALTKSAEQFQAQGNPCCAIRASSNLHSLYFNLVKNYLPPESSSDIKPFGLSQDKVLNAKEMKKSESEKAEFKQVVESNIDEFCKNLVVCTGVTTSCNDDWKNVFNRTMKEMESKVTFISSKENEPSKKKLKEMIKTYFEELSKGVELLSKALSLHEQKLDFVSHLSESYQLTCHAVFLKIRCLEMKILLATYNEETIPVLKKIKAQLEQKEEKLKDDQKEKTVTLESYLKLGEEYQRTVEEYAKLTKSIEEQQCAIDELTKSKSQYVTSA